MSKTPEEKFNNINIEPDTIIQSFRFLKIDGIDCRYEEWIWDGIEAEILIFCTDELKLTDEQYLRTLLSKFLRKDNIDFKEMTTKSSGNYTFINFNFKIKS